METGRHDGDSSTSVATRRTESATRRVAAKAEAIAGMFQIKRLFSSELHPV